MAPLRAAAAALSLAAAAGQVAVLESSRDGGTWVDRGSVPWAPPAQAEVYVTVDRARTYQTHMGFGGALTDTSAINYLLMNATSQRAFLDAYWGDVGAGSLGYNGALTDTTGSCPPAPAAPGVASTLRHHPHHPAHPVGRVAAPRLAGDGLRRRLPVRSLRCSPPSRHQLTGLRQHHV
jgi:hypothetical protein